MSFIGDGVVRFLPNSPPGKEGWMRFADGVVENLTSSVGLFSCPLVSVRGQSLLLTSNF